MGEHRRVPKAPAQASESVIAKKIVTALNAIEGVYCERVWTGGIYARVGQPDIVGCADGRMFQLEVKVPGKKARKVQIANMARWRRVGAIVGTVTSVEEARALIAKEPSP